MKTVALALAFLLAALALWANPFPGTWTADFITVVADQSTMTIAVASDDPDWLALAGAHRYTYDADVLRVGDCLVALYDFAADGDRFMMYGRLEDSDNFVRILFTRAPPIQKKGVWREG